MKVGIIQALGWLFIIREEINKAYSDDKIISAKEVLVMYRNISTRIELPIDEKTQKIIDLIANIVENVEYIADDNKVSINELIIVAQVVCNKLGYDLDKEGLSFDKK